HGFDQIEKGDQSRLLKVADNFEAIEQWRETLSPERRSSLNHPRTVLAAWEAATRVKVPTATEKTAPKPPETTLSLVAHFMQSPKTEQEELVRSMTAEALLDRVSELQRGQIRDRAFATLPHGRLATRIEKILRADDRVKEMLVDAGVTPGAVKVVLTEMA